MLHVGLRVLLVNVEPLEEAVEVQVLQVVRAEWQLGNDEFDILGFEL